MITFSASITISVEGVERELTADVSGYYHRAEPAYIPRGEYAAVDPPEPEIFELSSVTIERTRGLPPFKPIDIGFLLSDDQLAELERIGCEAAREAARGDPDRAYDERRDREMERDR